MLALMPMKQDDADDDDDESARHNGIAYDQSLDETIREGVGPALGL